MAFPYFDLSSAFMRIRGRSVTNITPFTYRDGMTYLEVLERLRLSIKDIAGFAQQFGDDVDDIIKDFAEKSKAFAENSNKIFEGYNQQVISDREALTGIKAMADKTVNDFKSKTAAAAFTVEGDSVSAPTIGGGRVDVASKSGLDAAKGAAASALESARNTLDAAIKKEVSDRGNAVLGEQRARQAAIGEINASLADRYTKAEAANLFESRTRNVAVFIGSSNSTSHDMTKPVADSINAEHHNYAIGGGAFTSSENSSFIQQAKNAFAGLGGKRVTHFFVTDMLNDIRANHDVHDKAKQCFKYIRDNFPDARIIVTPVVLNSSSLNKESHTYQSVRARISECARAGLAYNVEMIEGSPSWFIDHNLSPITDEGNNGVHLSLEGRKQLSAWIITYLRGGYTWRDTTWQPLKEWAQPSVDRASTNLLACRTRDIVAIQGNIKINRQLNADTVFLNVPDFGVPRNRQHVFKAISNDRNEGWFYINNLGQVAPLSLSVPAGTWNFHTMYAIW